MLSNDCSKEIFSNLDDSVVLWFYVSTEVEALRRANPWRHPAVISHTLLLFLAFQLPQYNNLRTFSVSILQAWNIPPEITDFITFYISLGSSQVFGSGPFVQPAGPRDEFWLHRGLSSCSDFLFLTLPCLVDAPSLQTAAPLNTFYVRRTLHFKNSFTYHLHRM